jgi:hypothetical protein
LSVMVRWIGLLANREMDSFSSESASWFRFTLCSFKIVVLPPAGLFSALLAEKGCQMPALISFYHGLRFLLTRWRGKIS